MNAAIPQPAPSAHSQRPALWARELPFSLVLVLTVLGVAYTSFTKQPIIAYWEVLVPIIGLLCVATGWHRAKDKGGRVRLVGTVLAHWLSFLVIMNLLFLPGVQRVFTAGATGLSIFTLLTLGTFTAGVHVFSWQVILLGMIMALGIPAIAWIENSALIAAFAIAGFLGICTVFWWHWREGRASP